MKNKQILASKLNRSITIEEEVCQNDEAGGYINSWQKYTTVPAEIIALNDIRITKGETYAANQLVSYGFYRITIRYREGITTKMRVLYNKKYFNIKRVINQDEKNKCTILIVEEGIE